jgi:hypothetical protein
MCSLNTTALDFQPGDEVTSTSAFKTMIILQYPKTIPFHSQNRLELKLSSVGCQWRLVFVR